MRLDNEHYGLIRVTGKRPALTDHWATHIGFSIETMIGLKFFYGERGILL